MKKNKWIIVTEKWTYWLLLSIPIGLGKFIFYDLQFASQTGTFLYQAGISLLIASMGLYFFVRLNSYSAWMNPNHPKP